VYEHPIDVLDIVYKNTTLTKGKHDSPCLTAFNFTAGTDGLIIKDNKHVKRWNGLIILDIDPPKEEKQKGTDNSKDIEILFNYFCELGLSSKVSFSKMGLHVFIYCDVKKLNDKSSVEAYDKVFKFLMFKYQTIVDGFKLKLKYKIDDSFLKNKTLGVALNKTTKFNIDGAIVCYEDVQQILNIMKCSNMVEFTETELLTDTDKLSIKEALDLLIPIVLEKGKGNHLRNEERWSVALLYHQCNYSYDDFLKLLDLRSKVNSKHINEYKSCWEWAKDVYNLEFYSSNWSAAFTYLNSKCGTKIYPRIVKKESIIADCKIEVNQYLTEKYSEIKTVLDANNKVLLTAATGSGKSTLSVQYANDFITNNSGSTVVLGCDTIALANQISNTYNLPVLCSKRTKNWVGSHSTSGIYISTYDSLKKFQSIDLLIVDECHQLVTSDSFRHNALSVLKNWMDITKTVAITATPQYLYPLFSTYKKLDIQVQNSVQNQFTILKGGKNINTNDRIVNHICDNVSDNEKVVVYINNESVLVKLKALLEKKTNLNCEIVRSGLESKTLKSIQENQKIPDDVQVVLTTSVLQNGVNILNKVKYVYTNELDITSLTQFVARFRLGGVQVMLLGANSNEDSKAYLMNSINYKGIIQKAERMVQNFNKIQNTANIKLFEDNRIDFSIFKNSSELYEVSEFGACYNVFQNNRNFYWLNPKTIIDQFSTVDISTPIEPKISIAVSQDLKAKKIELNKWIDDSCVYVYEAIKAKHENKKKTSFYTLNEPKLKSKEAENFYKDVKRVLKAFQRFSINDLDIVEAWKLVKKFGDPVTVIYAFYFNAIDQRNSKPYAIWFKANVDISVQIRFAFLSELKSKFNHNQKYKMDDIREKVREVLGSRNWNEGVKFSDSNNEIMNYLKMLFEVKSVKGGKQGEDGRFKEFDEFEIPTELERFKTNFFKKYTTVYDFFGIDLL
jgi:hypothetical protein